MRCVPRKVPVPEHEAVAEGQERVPEVRAELPEARVEVHEVPERVPEVPEKVRENQHEVREHGLPNGPSLLAAGADPQVPEAQQVDEAVKEDGGGTAGQHRGHGERGMPEVPEQRGLKTMPMKSKPQMTTNHENLPVAFQSTKPKASA